VEFDLALGTGRLAQKLNAGSHTGRGKMSAQVIWILLGVILIISELLATSVVAVFFGIAAIIVGLLMYLGAIESLATQFLVFGAVSFISLATARKEFKRWFKGYTADSSDGRPNFQHDIGERAVAVSDFHQGSGRVTLNGVRWTAYSDEDVKEGDTVWVIRNDGIQLTVSRQKISK
jgi:inner membrane protein